MNLSMQSYIDNAYTVCNDNTLVITGVMVGLLFGIYMYNQSLLTQEEDDEINAELRKKFTLRYLVLRLGLFMVDILTHTNPY